MGSASGADREICWQPASEKARDDPALAFAWSDRLCAKQIESGSGPWRNAGRCKERDVVAIKLEAHTRAYKVHIFPSADVTHSKHM